MPLRRLLIVQSHDELPYPEGTACAEVLRATVWRFFRERVDLQGHGARRGNQDGHLFAFLTPFSVHVLVPVLPKAELGSSSRRPCYGVGLHLGYRQSGVLVSGSLVSAVVLTPLIAVTGAAIGFPAGSGTTGSSGT